MKNIIFVCHGNICRSVAAEFLMKDLLSKYQMSDRFNVISRATSLEEIGNDIYPPMKRCLDHHNIPYETHHAKRISQDDYKWADYIFYMDSLNKVYLDRLLIDTKKIIKPISYFTSNVSEIDDPWYSGEYDIVVSQLQECIEDIIRELK